jgi:hypothetical protein
MGCQIAIYLGNKGKQKDRLLQLEWELASEVDINIIKNVCSGYQAFIESTITAVKVVVSEGE